MDAETFTDPNIAAFINANFYAVKFNAEGRDTVVYKGDTLTNIREGNRPPHEFAVKMLGGRMSYPTIVYIDADWNVNPVPGYMTPQSIEPILVFFAEKVNKSAEYPSFEKDFKNAYYPDSLSEKQTSGRIKWLTIDEGLKMIDSIPKKMLLFINYEYSNSSKIMLAATFRHPEIATYINEHYYPVKIEYDYAKKITIKGTEFINEKPGENYPHQFVIALLQPDFRVPSMIFFDENFNILSPARGYYPAQTIERFLNFFGDNAYKTKSWDEFNKTYINTVE
jgi:thioredoxin-related protein